MRGHDVDTSLELACARDNPSSKADLSNNRKCGRTM